MSQRLGRHTDTPVYDVAALEGKWHIGRHWAGLFPFHEASCPCPKTPCGLVAPVPDIPCREHHGDETIRQAHPADACTRAPRARRMPTLTRKRRKEPVPT